MSNPYRDYKATHQPSHFSSFVRSCDVSDHAQLNFLGLSGKIQAGSEMFRSGDDADFLRDYSHEEYADVHVEYTIEGSFLLPLQSKTTAKPYKESQKWQENLTVPLRIADLPRDARHVLKIFNTVESGFSEMIATASLSAFDDAGCLRWGTFQIETTPTTSNSRMNKLKLDNQNQAIEQRKFITDTLNSYVERSMPHLTWLDDLSSTRLQASMENLEKKAQNLVVSFQLVRYKPDVLFAELGGQPLNERSEKRDLDPEVHFKENLVESKHHKQTRGEIRSVGNHGLLPDSESRARLETLTAAPISIPLTVAENDMIWKFRTSLMSNRKALKLFVRCVDWQNEDEVKHATELLDKWDRPDLDDILGLLTKHIHPSVREYAVKRLRESDIADLKLYLLQLVQALRYEPRLIHIRLQHQTSVREKRSGSRFGRNRAKTSTPGNRKSGIDARRGKSSSFAEALPPESVPKTPLSSVGEDDSLIEVDRSQFNTRPVTLFDDSQYLSSSSRDPQFDPVRLDHLLIERATQDFEFASYLYWYLTVETFQGDSAQALFRHVLGKLLKGLSLHPEMLESIEQQREFFERLNKAANSLDGLSRPDKKAKLQAILKGDGFKNLHNLPIPINPDIKLKSAIADKAYVFKSAMTPLGIRFKTKKFVENQEEKSEYYVMFKSGDDIRQDQLVLQVISLMDRLLKKENLDLKLTPYRCLATSDNTGFVELVEGVEALENIVNSREFGSLKAFLQHHNPCDDEKAVNGIHPVAMDNYVKSLAGYSVITYVLGVGDRHLDNILIKKDGHIFHIDFGFLFGRDPKPYPPPIKLTTDMVDALGGTDSDNMQKFWTLCFHCYLSLRSHANIILNLFTLMVDSDVQDIAMERDKCIRMLEEKFNLGKTEEEALIAFKTALSSSLGAFFPRVVDWFHTFAQNRRQ